MLVAMGLATATFLGGMGIIGGLIEWWEKHQERKRFEKEECEKTTQLGKYYPNPQVAFK